MDESKIEVNKEVLQEIFKAANMQMPDNVSDEALKSALGKIKSQETGSKAQTSDLSMQNTHNSDSNATKNILVIDDIGVVTYQLKIMLRNLGYNVQIAKDIFSGINTFIRSNYAFVIMDLFVSTEQEGYTLLNETKKIITKNNLSTKIIVITASNKAENKIKCLNGGADVFLKKDTGWQDKLVELVENFDTLAPKA